MDSDRIVKLTITSLLTAARNCSEAGQDMPDRSCDFMVKFTFYFFTVNLTMNSSWHEFSSL